MEKVVKKIVKFVKKHDNILVAIILLIIMISDVYKFKINNNDELINFLNTYKMANGLIIYKDTNVIITPLFFYIGKILLILFGQNFVVYRTYNLILTTILYFLTYKILRELKVGKKLSLFYTVMIVAFTSDIKQAGANYNVLAYCIFELGLLLELKMKRGNKKNIVQGVILFLVFLANQKLAVGYFIALCIYNISNKNIKDLAKQLITAAFILVIYLAYLYCQENLYNFIDYTVLGIGEFKSNKALDSYFIQDVIYILLILLTLTIYIMCIITAKDKEKKKTYKLLIIFSSCALILTIPILNYYHLVLSSILMMTSLLYMANNIIEEFMKEKNVNILITISTLIFIFIIGIKGILEVTGYAIILNYGDKNSPFFGTATSRELSEEIEKVSEYIQNNDKDTIVFSTFAPFYSIQLNDLDNKVYDWPLRGNLGKEGEDGLIKQVQELENTQILLYESDDRSAEIYQFAYKVVDYIKENMEYVGKIESFDIYQTIK